MSDQWFEKTMKPGLNIFRIALAGAWMVLVWVSAKAVTEMGTGAAGTVFFGDMTHPWRAQFNTDFGFHLLLVAAWMIYRDRLVVRGTIFGFLGVMLGGVFTLAYIFIETFRSNGDMLRLLLGARLNTTGCPMPQSRQ